MARNNSDEINFQHYVDGVKLKKIPWNYFVDFIQDLSHSDINKLRHLNAILLMELTKNFSDIEKFKYLNEILLIQFKNHIEKEPDDDIEATENDQHHDLQESNDDQILNEEIFEERTKEMLANENIQIPIIHDIKEVTENDQHHDLQESNNDQILNEETFEERSKEISANEIGNDSISLKEETIECNPTETNPKIFVCYICNKEFNMNFHLKQHMRNIHEKKKSNTVQPISIHNDQKLDENESAPKSITQITNNLSLQIPTINDGLQDCKCEFCGKSFSVTAYLKKHINTIH